MLCASWRLSRAAGTRGCARFYEKYCQARLVPSNSCIACRLNWQLHFGETPKWSSGVKFLLADISPVARDGARSEVVLTGDAAAVAQQLTAEAAHVDRGRFEGWVKQLKQKVGNLASCTNGCTGWLLPDCEGLVKLLRQEVGTPAMQAWSLGMSLLTGLAFLGLGAAAEAESG